MSHLLLLSLIVCVVSCSAARLREPYALEHAETHFENFIQQYDKHYSNEHEKQARFQIFKDNLEDVNKLNENSEHTVFGITQFTDLTSDEFKSKMNCLGNKESEFKKTCKFLYDKDIPDANAPEAFDWREHNAVTPVKDQRYCGSCFAFSATGNVEGQYAIKYNKQIEISEQQIVDCDKRSLGCLGGFMSYALRAFIDMGGAESEADYPYKGFQGICNYDQSKVKVKLSDCRSYNLTSQEKLKQLVYHYGPIAIAVTAANFQNYNGGIMTDENCGTDDVDHGVLLVGYGTENGQPYWIIKNSWGKFGEDGYIRVQRGEGSTSCMMMNQYMAASIIV